MPIFILAAHLTRSLFQTLLVEAPLQGIAGVGRILNQHRLKRSRFGLRNPVLSAVEVVGGYQPNLIDPSPENGVVTARWPHPESSQNFGVGARGSYSFARFFLGVAGHG